MGATFDAAVERAWVQLREAIPDHADAEQQRLLAAALTEIDNLEVALEHRTLIGQATGMVMERYSLTSEAAMGVLRRLSQETNRKLYDIAGDLVGTTLLDVRRPGAGRASEASKIADSMDARITTHGPGTSDTAGRGHGSNTAPDEPSTRSS